MTEITINNIKIRCPIGMSEDEITNYIRYVKSKSHTGELIYIEILIDGDYVTLGYQFAPVKFDRIRRITGYLVGNMDNWNDAKISEENDRVKHNGLEVL